MFKLLALLLTIYASVAYGSVDYDKTLNLADSLRTSSPQQSNDLIKDIDTTQLSKSQKDLHNLIIAHNLFTFGKPFQAKELTLALLDEIPELPIKVRALTQLLTFSMATYDWSLAIQTAKALQQDLSLHPQLDARFHEQAQFKIFEFYNKIGEYQYAKKLGEELIAKATTPKVKCITKTTLLDSYMETTPEQIYLEDFIEAQSICQVLKDPLLDNFVNAYFAKYYLTINQPEAALELLNNNMNYVKTSGYQALIASFYYLMAEGYLATKNYLQAEKHAQIVLDTQQQHNYDFSITTAYKVLAEVTRQTQRFEQALDYYQAYSEAKQLNLDKENAKLLALQKAEFDDVEKNGKIALLDKENALLKTQALLDSAADQNKRMALALLALVLVGFVLWTYKNRRNYLRMQHYAQTDELTGIANRHYFTQQANTAITYCKRTDQPVSFIIFDLDYFKRINDTYGHQTGDIALKVAVEAAKVACRNNDIVGRLGGEEFGVLLPGCAGHLASFIAEKCRKAIEQADYTESGHAFTVTASFGVADSSTSDYNFEKLFAGADYALYQSKDMGRNRVVQYQEEVTI